MDKIWDIAFNDNRRFSLSEYFLLFLFFFLFLFLSSKNCAFLFRELYLYCSYVADLLKRVVHLYIVSMYRGFKEKVIEEKSFGIDLWN